ncbi:cell wall protein [Pyricularia oryzae 70-15]|uniref:Cell wall protein n=3 Tax=Pyricularia oryzae TaxID=318829 RepID=G4N275_PYRO7|nr:cell wall protein [Pyricularia oryzae 70-15]EHA52487.1 cell wall protein [Pyricularia oryzae 70-15]KAI7915505.1 cell wall protein [Pyricularia oryzae]KAI7916733.1 cell wall protein [Pyricularia oryzae]
MQLSSLLVFVGAVAALDLPTNVRRDAPTKVERDLATISRVVTDVDSKIKDLTDSIKNFNGDPAALSKASSTLTSTLNQGASDVSAGTSITLNEAITLQAQVSGLQSDSNNLISALTDKKKAFEDASLCGVIYQQSGDLGTNAKSLIDAVVSKVPQDVQSLAQQVASGFSKTLMDTQAQFAPGNCTNKGTAAVPGGGSGSGSGTPAASGSGGVAGGASSSAPTGQPVTAGAATFAAPVGFVMALAAASFLLHCHYIPT